MSDFHAILGIILLSRLYHIFETLTTWLKLIQ